MGVIASQPLRGDPITSGDRPTEGMSEFMSDISDTINRDLPQNNFIATTNPAVTDNASKGYTRGSEWINNSTNIVYKLTSFSGTNATWTALN